MADCQITRILSLRWVGKTSRGMILQYLDQSRWIGEGRYGRLLGRWNTSVDFLRGKSEKGGGFCCSWIGREERERGGEWGVERV